MMILRRYNDAFKAKVALETIKEIETISELASRYDVRPNQIWSWKSDVLENAAKVFGGDKDAKTKNKELEELHKHIGEQTTQIDFLKKLKETEPTMRKEMLEPEASIAISIKCLFPV